MGNFENVLEEVLQPFIFTELYVFASVPLFLNVLLLSFTNVASPIAKRFLREKLGKDNTLRFREMAQKWSKTAARKKVFVGLCHSLLMDLGHNEQHHPTVQVGVLEG